MKSIFIAIIIQAIISLLLIYQESGNVNRIKYLHPYLLIITIDFLHEMMVYAYFDNNIAIAEQFPGSFRFIKGPLLYFFVTKIFNKRTILLHSLPFLSAFILNIIVILSLMINEAPGFAGSMYQFLVSVYPYYWLAYLVFCLTRLQQQNDSRDGVFKFSRYLIIFLLLQVGVMWTMYLVFTDFMTANAMQFKQGYSLTFLVQFGLLIKLNHEIRLSDKQKIHKNKTKATSDNTNVLHKIIIEKVKSALTKEKLFLNEDLSLSEFASHIGFSRHQVTESINDGLQSNFYDLVNKYRVNEFKSLIYQNPKIKISDAMYQSGFKSKATFYKYFNKEEKISPKEFRANLID